MHINPGRLLLCSLTIALFSALSAYGQSVGGLFYTANLTINSSSAEVDVVSDPTYPNGQGDILRATKVGDYMTFLVPNIAACSYKVSVGIKKFNSRGQFQLTASRADQNTYSNVGGVIDEYNSSILFTEVTVGTWTPGTSNDKLFKLTVTGKQSASDQYWLSIDFIRLTPIGFPAIVSQAQFNQMFPHANSFYTYLGLVAACSSYPTFCTSGNATQIAQEACAALANFAHETGGLVYINEIQQSAYCSGTSTPCGVCASGQEYYGRGPIQISWNYNYCACGEAIGQNLWANPNLVSTNSQISWQTGLWYWMTQNGGSSMTPHAAILSGSFGATIRAINSIECNGGDPSEVQDRLNYYLEFLQILNVSAGSTGTGC
jgi:hypothetical protein